MGESYTNSRALAASHVDAAAMDESEFRALYEATARPILAYLLAVTRRRDVADDLLQEAYCRYLIRQPVVKDEEESRKYLFRIATNLLRDRWRNREDSRWDELVETPKSTNLDAQMDVRRVLHMLKPRERELLWLAYVEGMDHTEIASAMGLRTLSVRMLLFRARRKAAALLNPPKENA